MPAKKALICGISGQDGAYLSELLLKKGYLVFGTSRDAEMSSFNHLRFLEIRDRIQVDSMTLTDFRSVLQTISRIQPDEVYNLAGQTSVGLSFKLPAETLESISIGTLNLLEAIRFVDFPIRYYNACSSECFGDTKGHPASEDTAFKPRSPYAVAKSAAFWQVANYREAYSLFACSGILFNHESPLRPERFVTQKVIAAACRIASGSNETLQLGNISIERDWGWAPEYVEAMWKMLQQNHPDDFIIATGKSFTLQKLVETAFQMVGLDWEKYTESNPTLYRPTDIQISRANPSKADKKLRWQATYTMQDVVRGMIEHQKNME